MAISVLSSWNYVEFTDYIRERSKPRNKREMPCLRIGSVEFVNPHVMTVNDFAGAGALIFA
jgi:hypothetical protein